MTMAARKKMLFWPCWRKYRRRGTLLVTMSSSINFSPAAQSALAKLPAMTYEKYRGMYSIFRQSRRRFAARAHETPEYGSDSGCASLMCEARNETMTALEVAAHRRDNQKRRSDIERRGILQGSAVFDVGDRRKTLEVI